MVEEKTQTFRQSGIVLILMLLSFLLLAELSNQSSATPNAYLFQGLVERFQGSTVAFHTSLMTPHSLQTDGGQAHPSPRGERDVVLLKKQVALSDPNQNQEMDSP